MRAHRGRGHRPLGERADIRGTGLDSSRAVERVHRADQRQPSAGSGLLTDRWGQRRVVTDCLTGNVRYATFDPTRDHWAPSIQINPNHQLGGDGSGGESARPPAVPLEVVPGEPQSPTPVVASRTRGGSEMDGARDRGVMAANKIATVQLRSRGPSCRRRSQACGLPTPTRALIGMTDRSSA